MHLFSCHCCTPSLSTCIWSVPNRTHDRHQTHAPCIFFFYCIRSERLLVFNSFVLEPFHLLSSFFLVQSWQLGCACLHSTCSPERCDHVYLFDNDYSDAKDIYGKPMSGRFPYDEKGRIILEVMKFILLNHSKFDNIE